MREILVAIILLSVVSSETFEPKKRAEEDPNFWPTRGRRSYWSTSKIIGNSIQRGDPSSLGPEVLDYNGNTDTWGNENDILSSSTSSSSSSTPGIIGFLKNWRIRNICPRKNSVSLILPLQEYNPSYDELNGNIECSGRCPRFTLARGRDRRGDERWRRQQPLYAEEPKWIAINYDRGILGVRGGMGAEDPFIVTRGKKSNDIERQIFDVRERRQLDDVLNSYNVDPFFVARGKRSLKYDGVKNQSFKINFSNNPDSKLNNKIGTNYDNNNKGEKFQEPEIFGTTKENSKFVIDQENEGVENKHLRMQRSSTSSSSSSSSSSDLFEARDESKWIKKGEKPSASISDEFSVLKTRYSPPRDKHSNLQGILDEPFFVSRGKKMDNLGGVKYLQYENIEANNHRRLPATVNDKFFKTISNIKFDDNFHLDNLNDDIFKRSRIYDKKGPRNRRGGMLDDLLKGDDPFYVTRGKRKFIYPRDSYFDYFIAEDDEDIGRTTDNNNNYQYALFEKEKFTKTKLLRKLYDLNNKIRDVNEGNDFWNITVSAIDVIH